VRHCALRPPPAGVPTGAPARSSAPGPSSAARQPRGAHDDQPLPPRHPVILALPLSRGTGPVSRYQAPSCPPKMVVDGGREADQAASKVGPLGSTAQECGASSPTTLLSQNSAAAPYGRSWSLRRYRRSQSYGVAEFAAGRSPVRSPIPGSCLELLVRRESHAMIKYA
jgi:hypothetical protein